MLNKHTTPAFWAALDADRQAVLGRFGVVAGKLPPRQPVNRFDSRCGAIYEGATSGALSGHESAFVV